MTEENAGALITRFRTARRDGALAVLEGLHAVKHAHRFRAQLLEVVVTDVLEATSLARVLAPDLVPVIERAQTVDPDTYEQLAPVSHATGVMAIARRPAIDTGAVFGRDGASPIVLLERPSHLANIGAAVRVAAAAGAAGLFTLGGEDPWRPAALRGGAGLQYAIPCARLETLPASPRPLVALDPGGIPFEEAAIPAGAMLAFGSERDGLSDTLLSLAANRVSIPMREGVSSLNLATAVAVVLYGMR